MIIPNWADGLLEIHWPNLRGSIRTPFALILLPLQLIQMVCLFPCLFQYRGLHSCLSQFLLACGVSARMVQERPPVL